MVLSMALLLAIGQSHVDDKLPPLSRAESKKLLRESERQMADWYLRTGGQRDDSLLIFDRFKATNKFEGCPLIGRICEFSGRFGSTSASGSNYVIQLTLQANLVELYPFEALYPDEYRSVKNDKNQLVRRTQEHRDRVGKLKHQLWIHLPEDYRPPAKPPRTIDAAVRVTSVEWGKAVQGENHGNLRLIPIFRVHADLIKSEDLGLTASGVIASPSLAQQMGPPSPENEEDVARLGPLP